jgi:anthranilate synthase/aminodeoxychorismate synthase-like glutamine amidotransferase
MPDQINILDYFASADALGLKPSLLQFGTREICGINPITTLVVKNNKLYKNNLIIGEALDIFEHLRLEPSTDFFPAFIGFFAYEFSRYFGKTVHTKQPEVPEAFFRLYDQGLVIDNNKVIKHDLITIRNNTLLDIKLSKLAPGYTREEFYNLVGHIQQHIREGEVYQVNLSMPFYFDEKPADLIGLYAAMRRYNPSPFMGIIGDDQWRILSGSPERLFCYENNYISTRPIAGTKKRGISFAQDNNYLRELQQCPKENAEHAMLVDLMRNDLNCIADPNSVVVNEDRSVEFYNYVMHLVSEVSASSHSSLRDIFSALFPSGTITGAPKENVMHCIADLEFGPRGPYTGSLGYISGAKIDFNILIRSVISSHDQAWINTGAGIVIDSVAEQEWQEVHKKAGALRALLEKAQILDNGRALIKGPRVVKHTHKNKFTNKHILFIENNDSFSFNIIALLRNLGADLNIITIKSSDKVLPQLNNYTHVVVGPGPGNPVQLEQLRDLMAQALSAQLPLLGICLGHQALGHYFGAPIIKLDEPIHGKSELISHSGAGLFTDLASPFRITRYHSLALKYAPDLFHIDAKSTDGAIMAIRHGEFPLFGLQFHPESYLSSHGDKLIANFLRSSYD